jgi:hypothetical protein
MTSTSKIKFAAAWVAAGSIVVNAVVRSLRAKRVRAELLVGVVTHCCGL